MKNFFSRIFNWNKRRVWDGPDEYMDSQEFLDDIHEAAVKGAQDQERYLNSMGKSFSDF